MPAADEKPSNLPTWKQKFSGWYPNLAPMHWLDRARALIVTFSLASVLLYPPQLASDGPPPSAVLKSPVAAARTRVELLQVVPSALADLPLAEARARAFYQGGDLESSTALVFAVAAEARGKFAHLADAARGVTVLSVECADNEALPLAPGAFVAHVARCEATCRLFQGLLAAARVYDFAFVAILNADVTVNVDLLRRAAVPRERSVTGPLHYRLPVDEAGGRWYPKPHWPLLPYGAAVVSADVAYALCDIASGPLPLKLRGPPMAFLSVVFSTWDIRFVDVPQANARDGACEKGAIFSIGDFRTCERMPPT